MAEPLFIGLPDAIGRRVMCALELRDPVTGMATSAGLAVAAAGLGTPVLTPSHRFVWPDRDPPQARGITVKITSRDSRFANAEEVLQIPAHMQGTPAADLLKTISLQPTGLYRPPAGITAVTAMLVEAAGQRDPVAGAEIILVYPGLASTYVATSDARGGFVAPFPELGALGSAPPPERNGQPLAWLELRRGTDPPRFSPLLDLRRGRSIELPQPLIWADLSSNPPPVP